MGGYIMKKRLISIILALTLSLGSAVALVSCDDTEKETETPTAEQTETDAPTDAPTEAPTDAPTEAPTETSDDTEATTETATETEAPTETETETETATESEAPTESETETDPTDLLYANGDAIKEAGAQLKDSVFSLSELVIDESKAVSITADEIKALLTDKKALSKDMVYVVTEPLVLDSNTKYYGNFAAIIAKGGVVIKDAEEIVIKELLVKGNVTVENSKGITFFKLGLLAEGVGIKIDEKSSDIAVKTCRVEADEIAFECHASLVSCSQNYFSADKGIVTTGSDFAIITSHISAVSAGIVSSGAYFNAKNCNVTAASDGVGFDLVKGSYNALVALNVVKDVQVSIRVNDGYNCVVLLNSAVKVEGKNNTNLYVVEKQEFRMSFLLLRL